MEPAPKLTPMMQQYWDVKKQIPPGALLMFRMGDFYEMFGEDAELGSRILGVTLTQRGGMAILQRIEDLDHEVLAFRPTLEKKDMAGIAIRSLFSFGRRFIRGEV